MAERLSRIADLAIGMPKRVLLVAVCLAAACGALGSAAISHLLGGGQFNPDSQSARANSLLSEYFGQGDMDLVLLVKTPNGIDDPETARAGRAMTRQIGSAGGVASVLSPWTAPPSVTTSLVSKDGKSAMVLASVAGGEEQAPSNAKAAVDAVVSAHDGLAVLAGGTAIEQAEIAEQSQKDLLLMEAIAVPLSFIALIWVFGGLYAAMLPIVVGGLAVVGTLAELRLLTEVTQVSVYAMNVTTAMALALGIDYTLLMVSRYREEARRLGDRDDALRAAVGAAGRTVLFSAVTVALAASSMTLFPMYFLRSMAYTAMGVVAVAAASAVVVAPALIVLLGDRIGQLSAQRQEGGERNFWRRSAERAMRRPVLALVCGVLVLLVLGSPFLRARFGTPTDQVLPPSSSARQVGDQLRAQFQVNPADVTSIVLSDVGKTEAAALGDYANQLSRVSGVDVVNSPDGAHHDGSRIGPPSFSAGAKAGRVWLTVVRAPSVAAFSEAATEQLRALRAVPPPGQAKAEFTGQEQLASDATDGVMAYAPLVLGLIALSTFVLLFLLTGSIVLPIKSLVLNTLSLTAALGALVWVFQEGHLGALGTTPTGTLALNMLVFMSILSFGISMDYEVFIVSRIREHWLASDQTPADNERSVALGVATSGRIVTAAAMLMCIVFASMCSAQVSFMRMFGVFLVLAVGADATLVRMVLVPAFMKLAGRWNWWVPKPLGRLHSKAGFADG